jgi:hypothetical protein
MRTSPLLTLRPTAKDDAIVGGGASGDVDRVDQRMFD